jgi:hypothetical protein
LNFAPSKHDGIALLRTSRSSRLPSKVPSVAAACFWLVVECFFDDRRPSKATMYFIFIFLSFHLPPPNDSKTLPPHVPPRSRALPNILPYRCHQLWVDCCVSSSNGGHLRPRPHLSLYFSMGCVLGPQTGEPTAAPPNPMARTFHGTIGSGGAMIWWRRWPNHGGRGLKPLEGRAVAAHFGCCVLCVLCLWLCAPFSYHIQGKMADFCALT